VGFCADSRRLESGQAFVALKTDRRDGHDFVAQAEAAGAAAAIVSRVVPAAGIAQLVVDAPLSALQAIAREHRKTFRGTVVGVTGSVGKTSTKELLSALLGADSGATLATEGNLNNHIGVALTLTRIEPGRHAFAVIEAGISAPGEMGVLAAMIEPNVALVTLVGPAHLEELGGLEGVAREKADLVRALRPGGLGLFPSSCERFEAFRKLPHGDCVVIEPAGQGGRAAQGRVLFSASHADGETTVELAQAKGRSAFTLRRVSDGMAQNAALAIVAALRLGISEAAIRQRLLTWHSSPLRGEWRISPGRWLYLDCYNANPASMADALAVFSEVAPRDEPRLLVLGCMEELGGESRRYHHELGRSLKLRPEDQLVVVGGLAEAVRQGAIEGGVEPNKVTISESVAPLADRLSAFKGAVFVKGSRRHELEKAFAPHAYAESSHA
jgi:UDP-N-acetylmuramoyl-tripeptide--D-alanyl-D-alanine ligase